MNKKVKRKGVITYVLPVIALTVSLGGFALAQSNLLPESKTIAIEERNNIITNSIRVSQMKALSLEGVSNLFYYNGEEEIAIGIRTDEMETPVDEWRQEDYRQADGKVYTYNINTALEKAVTYDESLLYAFDTDFGAGFSPNGKFIDSVEENRQTLYNLETGEKVVYGDVYLHGNWLSNGTGLVKYGDVSADIDYVQAFYIYDTKGNLINKQVIPEEVNWVALASPFYSTNGERVQFIGRVYNDNHVLMTGIYEFSMADASVSPVLEFKHEDRQTIKNPGTDLIEHPGEYLEVVLQNSIHNYTILSNGQIIFSGMVDSVQGLYLYDPSDEKVRLLLSIEGGINYKVAPDESKIVYTLDEPMYPRESQKDTMKGSDKVITIPNDTNVFVANFTKEELSNITYIKKDTFATSFSWSNDSRKLLFHEVEKGLIQQVQFK